MFRQFLFLLNFLSLLSITLICAIEIVYFLNLGVPSWLQIMEQIIVHLGLKTTFVYL